MNNEIDNVFKELINLINQNVSKDKMDEIMNHPNKSLYDLIYHGLIFRGVKNEDRSFDLAEEGMFKRFIENKRPNTFNFVDPSWNYFCQFMSSDMEARLADNHIKVYIPLDHEHVERGTNEIFDFLDEHKIKHISKIGKRIRFDDLVVRLINHNDLHLLLWFIKNNKYIQEGLIKPDPFAFQEGNIAVVSDGKLSYNSAVSNYIMLYFIKLYKEKKLDSANAKDFYRFVIDYYAKTFVSNDNLEQFGKDFSSTTNLGYDVYYQDPLVYNNYKYVSKLIFESKAKDYSLNNLLQHYDAMRKDKGVSQQYSNVKKQLEDMIRTMIKKNDPLYNIQNIYSYIVNGYPYNLTREDDCRNRICNSNFRQDMNNMIYSDNIDLESYLLMNLSRIIGIDFSLLSKYLTVASNKYGSIEDAYDNLESYLSTGDRTYITRDENLRSSFEESNILDKVNTYLKFSCSTLNKFISQIPIQQNERKK